MIVFMTGSLRGHNCRPLSPGRACCWVVTYEKRLIALPGVSRPGSHWSFLSQEAPVEREAPVITNQLFFIKRISFISHSFAASLVSSQVSVGFRHH